jgi:predicted nuclease of predicted toxin-antitoxin system
MKILLDECLPQDLRHALPGHEVHTAHWAGFKGMKNGDLLRAAEDQGYQVLLTADRGIPHQQHLASRIIAVMVLQTKSNQLEDLLPLANAVAKALETVQAGEIVCIPAIS